MSGTNLQFLYLLTNQSLLRVAVSGGPKTKAFFFLEAEGVFFGGEGRRGATEGRGRFEGGRGVMEGLGRTVEGLLSNWQKVIGSE
jgi:hypothetical protein